MTFDLPTQFVRVTEQNYQGKLLVLWVGAFFFHTVADPLATYVAVEVLAVGVEANPVVRTWLQAGPGVYLLAHLPLYAIGVGGFVVLRWLLARGTARERRQVYLLSVVVLSAINVWGFALVCNTLWVICTAA